MAHPAIFPERLLKHSPSESVIDELSADLDCSFLHGDGSNPRILREAGPEETDFLF